MVPSGNLVIPHLIAIRVGMGRDGGCHNSRKYSLVIADHHPSHIIVHSHSIGESNNQLLDATGVVQLL